MRTIAATARECDTDRTQPEYVVFGQRVVEVLVEEEHGWPQQRPVVVVHLAFRHVRHLQFAFKDGQLNFDSSDAL